MTTHEDFLVAADQLLANALEREGARSGVDRRFAVVSERVGARLSQWVGGSGWDALLDRARREASSRSSKGTTGFDDLRVLILVAEILARLIGHDLALRLVAQACEPPDDSPGRGSIG